MRRLGGEDSDILSLSTRTLAERTGVGQSTAREWRRLKRIPEAWRRAARALVLGDIGAIDPTFKGWRVEDGHVRAPDGGEYVFSVADLMFLPFARRMIARLESDLRRAREEMRRALEDQEREHASRLAELNVPTQVDWLTMGTSSSCPAPTPQACPSRPGETPSAIAQTGR